MNVHKNQRGHVVLTTISVGLVIFLLVWPLFSGYSFVHDEYSYCITSHSGHTFLENLRSVWAHRQYRLLDLLAGYLCDTSTLDARWTMALQAPALAVILWGIRKLSLRVVPTNDAVASLAIVWFGLHTSTSVSLWLPTVGQTWGAAAGLALGVVAWSATDQLIRDGRIRWPAWATILAIGLVGPHLKETYYGWAAAIGFAVLLRGVCTKTTSRISWFLLVLAVVGPALAHGIVRSIWGGLAQVTQSDQGRYSARFGMNLLSNIALSAGGQLAVSPVHYIHFPAIMKTLALAGVGLSGLLVATALRTVPTRRTLALALGTSFLATSITWPTHRISELYLMGPNAGAAIAAAAGALKLWNLRTSRMRLVGRATVVVAFGIGAIGLASRAAHFRVTWTYGRVLYAQARDYQGTLSSGQPVHTVGLAATLGAGLHHSQYMMSPMRALNPATAGMLLNLIRPDRPIRILSVPTDEPCCDLMLGGETLPASPSW